MTGKIVNIMNMQKKRKDNQNTHYHVYVVKTFPFSNHCVSDKRNLQFNMC